ncbi:MAG: Crp/Fnr family transcriptional regulator [Myxococcota bacterium]
MDRTKTSFLHRSVVLDHASADALHRIALRSAQVHVERRGTVWAVGAPVTALYWIRSGIVSERILVPNGRELILAFRGRGDVIGEVGAITAASVGRAVHATMAVAHEEVLLYALPVEEIPEIVASDPSLALAVAALTAERRQRAEERLATGLFRSAQARLAAALLDLASTFGVRDSRGVIVNLRLTHRDLAALAGASRETASVALLDWRRDGWIQVEGKRVVLLDPERLSAVARDG